MVKQYGGIMLRSKSKRGFQPIYDMLSSRGAILKLVSYSSLYGFIVSLDVQKRFAEYYGFVNGGFNKLVTSYIIKIVIITHTQGTALPPFKHSRKRSEGLETFFDEAKIQQNTWRKSVSAGMEELCPPVANFSVFAGEDFLRFTDFLVSISFYSKMAECAEYLQDYAHANIRNASMGIIVMPNIPNSVTYYKFKELHSEGRLSDSRFVNGSICILAKLLFLLLKLRVFHHDFHSGNSMVSVAPPNDCMIIDFGRTSDLNDQTDNKFLNAAEKLDMINHIDLLMTLIAETSDNAADKLHVIDAVVDYLFAIDGTVAQKLYGIPLIMVDVHFWYDNSSDDEKVLLFERLRSMLFTAYTAQTEAEVDKLEQDGQLPNFGPGRNVHDFLVSFAPDVGNALPPSRFPSRVMSSAKIEQIKKRKRMDVGLPASPFSDNLGGGVNRKKSIKQYKRTSRKTKRKQSSYKVR